MNEPGSSAQPEPSAGATPAPGSDAVAATDGPATPAALAGPEAPAQPDAAAQDLAPPAPEAAAEAPLSVDAAQASTAEAPPPTAAGRRFRFGRPRFLHLPRSGRGLFALLLTLGGIGTLVGFGGVAAIQWTETADFCGRCHQMGSELVAYSTGPHREVACGECHVEPGFEGWVKAKMNGTRQLIQVLTGLYPQPVPPPDHANLPPVQDTCLRCHSIGRLKTATLKTRTAFTEDEANSRQFIGLMVRPGGGDVFNVGRSVHWHVLQDVEYRSLDENAQKIDWVAVTRSDGTYQEFIAQEQVKVTDDVRPDLERIKAQEQPRRMDCLVCHNRVGHPIPNPRQALDQALVQGRIDPSLPYVKREAMRILWGNYPSEAAADAETERLRDFYQVNYPVVYQSKATEISQAIEQIKALYRLAATPEMKVSARTYPDNLGHTDFPGCFRCHDGGHFLVQNGAATAQTIPSSCDTCHTFPQIGPAIGSLPLGVPPDTHKDPLYVFDHRNVTSALDPGGTSCGECHARDFCVNCHSTGAVTVDHDEMLTNHAAVIRQSGNQACAYCHQPIYCARCHAEPVLPGSQPLTSTPPGASPPGLRWPLVVASGRTANSQLATGPPANVSAAGGPP